MEVYKVILKNGTVWKKPFTSIEELKECFEITSEEWETQTFKEIKEIRVYDEKGRYVGTQKELMRTFNKVKKVISQMKENFEKQISPFVELLTQQKYLIYINLQMEKNQKEYEQLLSDGKVKGLGVKIPIGIQNLNGFNPNHTLDDDGIYVDYLIKSLKQYGFEVGEHPPIMFVPYSGRCMITKGINMDDYFWVGMDVDITPNKYGFNIHNHFNPHSHKQNDINLSFELIEDYNNGIYEGIHRNVKRFNLGTTIIIMSMIKDKLTKEEMEMLMLSDNSYNYKDTNLNKLIWFERLNLMEIKLLSDEFNGERIKDTTIEEVMENPNHKWIDVDDTFEPIDYFKIHRNPTSAKGKKLIGETINVYGGITTYKNYMEWDF